MTRTSIRDSLESRAADAAVSALDHTPQGHIAEELLGAVQRRENPQTAQPAPQPVVVEPHVNINTENHSNQGDESSLSTLGRVLLAFFALGIYYWDWTNGFVTDWNFLYPIYLLLALFFTAYTWRRNSGHNPFLFFRHLLKYLFVVALFGILLPHGLKWMFETFFFNDLISDLSYFLLLLFPPLYFFMIYDPEFGFGERARKIISFYCAIWLLIAVLLALGSVSIPAPADYTRADTWGGAKDTFERLTQGLGTFGDKIKLGINSTRYLEKLDPYYYTGTVEANKDEPLGVRLEDVGPQDPYFFTDSEPAVIGYVSAESFLNDVIFVTPTCRVTKRGNYPEGYSDPVQLEVFRGHDEFFACKFPEGFEPGRYPVEVGATFDFETWADITYDFVHEEKARDFARLSRDIHRELGISQIPEAVYTNGPVMVGMRESGARLPILVIDEEPYLKNAYLGFTIQSQWPRGAINDVYNLTLSVPRGFELLECDRRQGEVIGPIPDKNVIDAEGQTLYEKYIFRNIVDATLPYTSVRCKMAINDPQVVSDLLNNEKITRTFIATAHYSFTVTETTEFEVEK